MSYFALHQFREICQTLGREGRAACGNLRDCGPKVILQFTLRGPPQGSRQAIELPYRALINTLSSIIIHLLLIVVVFYIGHLIFYVQILLFVTLVFLVLVKHLKFCLIILGFVLSLGGFL